MPKMDALSQRIINLQITIGQRRWPGALGHVRPSTSNIFPVNFRDAHSLSATLLVASRNIFVFCSSIAAVVRSQRLHETCSVHYFASFYVRQEVSCSFVLPSPAPDRGDASGQRREKLCLETSCDIVRHRSDRFSELVADDKYSVPPKNPRHSESKKAPPHSFPNLRQLPTDFQISSAFRLDGKFETKSSLEINLSPHYLVKPLSPFLFQFLLCYPVYFTWLLLVFVQLLFPEEKDKERPANVEDDEDGHLIYNINDVIRKRCECSNAVSLLCTKPIPTTRLS